MQRTREALIKAGLALFGEKGLDAPSLDEICERAGYTRGAFYVHFKGRDDFLLQVMSEVGAKFLNLVIATAGKDDHGGLAETARRFVAALELGAYPLMQPSGVRPHQLMEACARSPKIRARYAELVDASIARVGRVVEDDQVRRRLRQDIEPEEIARMVLALIVGVQTLWDLGILVDVPRLATATLRLLGDKQRTR
jgi:AcrR family transcriptional regulator